MPAFEEILLDSDEYGPSFDQKERIVYNVVYRLGSIYENTYLIERAIKEFFKHHHDSSSEDEPKLLQEYVMQGRYVGELLGI
jgi:hypothetical protein